MESTKFFKWSQNSLDSVKYSLLNLNGKYYFREIGMDGRIILKFNLEKQDMMVCTELDCVRIEGFFWHGNELSGSVKGRNFSACTRRERFQNADPILQNLFGGTVRPLRCVRSLHRLPHFQVLVAQPPNIFTENYYLATLLCNVGFPRILEQMLLYKTSEDRSFPEVMISKVKTFVIVRKV